MKVIANQTVRVGRQKRAPNPANQHDRGEYERRAFAPDEEFETKDWDVSDEQAQTLIASGAVRRKVREVADDGEAAPVAMNTAPRGPASGTTEPPDPNAVARDAKTAKR